MSVISPGAVRVLVVDDEQSLLHLVEEYLSRFGYDVVARSSAQEAWAELEPWPTRFSIVMVDLNMPGMSGGELLQKIVKLNPAIRILVCSGSTFDPSSLPRDVSRKTGFLQKPFLPRMLLTAVESLLKNDSPLG